MDKTLRPPLMSRLRRQLRGTAKAWMPVGTAGLPEPLCTWLAAKRPSAPGTPGTRTPWLRSRRAAAEHGPAPSWLTRRNAKGRRSA